jgi:uncharacterized protein (TIGR04255 family)
MPTYPNQQLRAVGLETFFKGRLGFREAGARVQQAVEKRLPHLYVPNAKPGQALDLQPYQLRNDGSTESLALAANQVTYVSYAYPGYDRFKTEALGLIRPALTEFGVDQLERVVYRYENEITINRDDDQETVHIDKILKVPSAPWWQGDALTEVTTAWTQRTPQGRLGIRIAVEGEKPMENLLISIVSVVVPAGSVGDLEQFVSCAHEAASGWFEGVITDEFRTYIKEEPDA